MIRRFKTIFTLGIVSLILIVGATVLFNDTTAPAISLAPESEVISTALPFTLTVTDDKNPIRKVSIVLKRAGRIIPVLEREFKGDERSQKIIFSLKDTGIKDSTVELEITATDGSFAGFGFGNTANKIYQFTIDNEPPKIQVKTSRPNIHRGGSAVVVYSISKPVSQTGIKVDRFFFPGFRQSNGDFVCYFAYPYYMGKEEFNPQLIAVDLAGNIQILPVQAHKVHKEFRQDKIGISQHFLDKKDDELARILPGEMSQIERFVKVNSEIRAANAAKLLEIGRETSPDMLWNNSFLALPRGAVRAGFAEYRTYLWNGDEVDHQVHLGYDLASTAQAPVPVANDGIVVFADYLGIYGNVVVVDHGLGLQSLYSHLTDIAVNKGQQVKRGDTVGRTGATGMALGDHLHFGILLSGLEVAPTEWLDGRWIQNNITNRIKEAGGTAPNVSQPQTAATPDKKKEATPRKPKPGTENKKKKTGARR